MYPLVLHWPRKRIPLAAAALALGALTTSSRSGLADPPTASAADDAAALVRAGRRAQLAGRLDEAEASFRAAFAMAPDAEVALDLALCELAGGKAREAAERLARLLRSADGRLPDERRERAAQALADARQKVATVSITARPALASLLVDGVPATASPPAALFLSPGRHSVRGTLDGHRSAQASFEAEAGRSYSVRLELLPLPPAPAPPPPPPPLPSPPGPAESFPGNLFVGPRGVVRGAGLTLAAAAFTGGFASLAAAAVSESIRQTHAARLRPDACSEASAGVPHDCVVVSDASEARNVASRVAGSLFVGAGAVAIATLASIFFLPAPRTRPTGAPARITLAPAAALGGGGLFLEGSW